MIVCVISTVFVIWCGLFLIKSRDMVWFSKRIKMLMVQIQVRFWRVRLISRVSMFW